MASQNQHRRFTHTDIDLMKARMKLSSGQRIQAMLDARAILFGIMRGRIRHQYPDIAERELNLKVIEEIDRVQQFKTRTFTLSGHSA